MGSVIYLLPERQESTGIEVRLLSVRGAQICASSDADFSRGPEFGGTAWCPDNPAEGLFCATDGALVAWPYGRPCLAMVRLYFTTLSCCVSISWLFSMYTVSGFYFSSFSSSMCFSYTIGYLVELPVLNNQIRSVDTTMFGWAVALVCYPPFNTLTGKIMGSMPVDFPHFQNPVVHVSANFLLLSLMAVYTSASVALNFKASNLTHRGIIASGPYRIVRHPAYACKNLAWWIAAIPAIAAAYEASFFQFASAIASVIGWSIIYAMRALTEEYHLRKVNDEYDLYCKKVRYRFIPGLL